MKEDIERMRLQTSVSMAVIPALLLQHRGDPTLCNYVRETTRFVLPPERKS